MADFLFEIGLEEVPARMIESAEDELRRRIGDLLLRERLLETVVSHAVTVSPIHEITIPPTYAIQSYSTPRRLGVLIRGVDTQQTDVTEEVIGPATKIAFKDGVPTPAAEAFARKSGVAVGELRTITTAKGEYLAATSVKKGRSAAEVIVAELPKEIAGIYWAKNMYWRAGKPEKFVRPVLWMVCLLGDEVVPVSFGGKTAGRASFGHRVLSGAHSPTGIAEAFEVQSPESYLAQLEGEYVLADVEVRRQKIRKALDKVTREVAGARWREDEALVDAVTHLTEWPDVLLGGFEAAYLELPEEVLVTVMRDHQKYFAVEDAQGKLAPHFLTVTNIALDAGNVGIIRQGNERVLKARFNDARFFWEFDQRTPLVERVKLLENVTFQKDLGSYAKKSERVVEFCRTLSGLSNARGTATNENALIDAARLAKTDLTTELVKEFTELQGIIGGLYARDELKSIHIDEPRATITWQAIYDQYLPASAKDSIPRSAEGAILGLADRVDTITGMFTLGMEPTGSKDPFALRRAANAVVRILAESGLPLKLSDVLKVVDAKPEVAAKLRAFFIERIGFYLRESLGNAYDTVSAVMNSHLANDNLPSGATGYDDINDLVRRASAVSRQRGSADFMAVCTAYKRLKNIYVQAKERNDGITYFESTFATEIEIELWKEIETAGAGYRADCMHLHYDEALQKLGKLRPVIDRYFEEVMVMVDDLEVRANRLGMVRYLVITFAQVADFSEIVTAG